MKTPTKTALALAAHVKATSLCDGALQALAAGRKVFVKGKATVVPFSPEIRAQRKALQLSAFEPGYVVESMIVPALVDVRAEGAFDEASEERIIAEAVSVYCAAGRAEVERRFAV